MSTLGQWLFEQQKKDMLEAVGRRQPRSAVVQAISGDSVTVIDPLTGTAGSQLLPVLGQMPEVAERVIVLPLSDGSRVAIRLGIDAEPNIPTPTIAIKEDGVSVNAVVNALDFYTDFIINTDGASEIDIGIDKTKILATGPPYAGGHIQAGRALYFTTHYPVGTLSGFTLTANRLYYVPIWVPKNLTATGMIFEVTTALSGSVQLGLYDSNDGFLPTSRLTLGTKTTVSTIGIKTFASGGMALSGGRWYFIGIASTTAMALRGSAVAADMPSLRGGHDQASANAYLLASETLAGGWANLPASATPGSLANTYLHVGVTV